MKTRYEMRQIKPQAVPKTGVSARLCLGARGRFQDETTERKPRMKRAASQEISTKRRDLCEMQRSTLLQQVLSVDSDCKPYTAQHRRC